VSERKRIFIVVKTYPTISKEYSELVCTAGILEDGSWIRLYPIPFRKLDLEQKYPKYTWIEVEVDRNTKDFRPETYRPVLETLVIQDHAKEWEERRNIIFSNKKIYTNMQELISKAKTEKKSLAVFKPTKIHDFIYKEVDREWDKGKLSILKGLSKQMNFFQTPEEIADEFKTVRKVPYEFSYVFEDDSGHKSTLMIEDWELGMLYFNCLQNANEVESVALSKVKDKFLTYFNTRDLYFFLGTTKQYHNVARNPFIIIGVFYPPILQEDNQIRLF
jgi:hypothetical protein